MTKSDPARLALELERLITLVRRRGGRHDMDDPPLAGTQRLALFTDVPEEKAGYPQTQLRYGIEHGHTERDRDHDAQADPFRIARRQSLRPKFAEQQDKNRQQYGFNGEPDLQMVGIGDQTRNKSR